MRLRRFLSPIAALLPVFATAVPVNEASPAKAPDLVIPVYPGIATKTVVSTYTTTFTFTLPWPNSRVYTIIDHITRTAYQPGPFPASALPTTVTQLVVQTVLHESRITDFTYSATVSSTTFSNFTGSNAETFVVNAPEPTHMPATAAV